MVNVLLPMAMYMLNLGTTIDLRNYLPSENMFEINYDDQHVLKKDIKSHTASYYVLPDETTLYSKLRMPLDVVLRLKDGIYNPYYPPIYIDTHDMLKENSFGGASILVVSEYRTIETSLKEGSEPKVSWRESIAETHTHYADKLIYGGKLASLITIQTIEKGDAQIVKRLLREALGTSGTIGDDTADLWNKTFHSIQNHPDIREVVYVGIRNALHGAHPATGDIYNDPKSVIELARDLPKYTYVQSADEAMPGMPPILIHFKPLSDIDERYISLEKNVEGEKYMKKIDIIEKDVTDAYLHHMHLLRPDPTDESDNSVQAIYDHMINLQMDIQTTLSGNMSLYTDIDIAAFQRVFDKYQEGLKGYSSYVERFQNLHEMGNEYCMEIYLKPTRGFLNLGKDQGVVTLDDVDLEDCQDACLKDQKCRSVAHTEKGRKCWIYPRSTVTTPIVLPEEGDMEDVKIYDRRCP